MLFFGGIRRVGLALARISLEGARELVKFSAPPVVELSV
jgi:hypothetical protein